MRPRLPTRRPRAVTTFFAALLVLICFTFATFTTVAAQSATTDVELRARADAISKSQPHLVHLLPRQATTEGKDTNADSDANGGGKSAETAASAAGASINTGAGGDRSTPASRKQFAELLSGLFFGTLFTLILGGAFIVQAWHYFERFGSRGSDRLILQILVAVLMFFSIFQMCILIHRIYDLHVAHFGNFAFPLLTIGWEVAGSFVCIGFMSGSVQLYFAHRVWLSFKKSKIILIPAIILISWTFCGGVASAALVIRAGSTANVKGQALHAFLPNSAPWQFSVIFATWLCSNAAIDVWLCVALLMQLSKMHTPFYHTRHAVARLLLLSLETCFATTACSFVSMILFLSVPYQFYYYIPFMPIGQIYGSSLVVTLMLRPSIARELAQDQVRDKVTEAPSLGGTGLGPSNGAPEETVVTHVLGPSSLVTPVLRRLMRREERKRPRTDVAVQLTTTVHETFSHHDAHDIMANGAYGDEEGAYGELAGTNRSSSNKSLSDVEGGRPSLAKTDDPPYNCSNGDNVEQSKDTHVWPVRSPSPTLHGNLAIGSCGSFAARLQAREPSGHNDQQVKELASILASEEKNQPSEAKGTLVQFARKSSTIVPSFDCMSRAARSTAANTRAEGIRGSQSPTDLSAPPTPNPRVTPWDA